MNGWVSSSWVAVIGWALIHFVWQGVIVACGVTILFSLLRRKTPSSRYLAGLLGLVALTICPVVTVAMLHATKPTGIVESAPIYAATTTAEPIVVTEGRSTETPLVAPPDARTDSANIGPSEVLRRVSFSARVMRSLDTALAWFVATWLGGVVVLSFRLLFGWLGVRRLCTRSVKPAPREWLDAVADLGERMAVSQPVRVLQSAFAEVPTVIGWLRPVILIPASVLTGLPPEQLRVLLAHELAHVRRYDYLVNLFQIAIETLLFYHPVVWWLSAKIRQEREYCCDDLAVKVCGDRQLYARTLTALAEMNAPPATLAVTARGGLLLPRIRRILGRSHEGRKDSGTWLPAAAVMVIVTTVFLGIACNGNSDQILTETTPSGTQTPGAEETRSLQNAESDASAKTTDAANTLPPVDPDAELVISFDLNERPHAESASLRPLLRVYADGRVLVPGDAEHPEAHDRLTMAELDSWFKTFDQYGFFEIDSEQHARDVAGMTLTERDFGIGGARHPTEVIEARDGERRHKVEFDIKIAINHTNELTSPKEFGQWITLSTVLRRYLIERAQLGGRALIERYARLVNQNWLARYPHMPRFEVWPFATIDIQSDDTRVVNFGNHEPSLTANIRHAVDGEPRVISVSYREQYRHWSEHLSDELAQPGESSEQATVPLAEAVREVNRQQKQVPGLESSEPLTVQEVLARLQEVQKRISSKQMTLAEYNALLGISETGRLPINFCLRHFSSSQQVAGYMHVAHGSFFRLMVVRGDERPFAITIRDSGGHRPVTQRERQFVDYCRRRGHVPSADRLITSVSGFSGASLSTNVPSVNTAPFVQAVTQAINEDNVDGLLKLYYWQDADEETRDFVRREAEEIVETQIKRVIVMPVPYQGKVRHWQPFKTFEPNLEITGSLAIVGGRKSWYLELGEKNGQVWLVNYVAQDDSPQPKRFSDFHNAVQTKVYASQTDHGDVELSWDIEVPDELAELRQANQQLWVVESDDPLLKRDRQPDAN